MNYARRHILGYGGNVGMLELTPYFSVPASNREILLALNTNARSWNIITHSLLITFYAALGRIFDDDRRSLTIHSFLSKCKAEIGQFSKASLEARRLRDSHGARPDWLTDYLQEMYEPVAADFDELMELAKRYKEIYISNYQPIRHKIIAHKDLATIDSRETLFEKSNIGEIQEMLQFLHQVGRVVAELHMNGRQSRLSDHLFSEEHYVQEDIANLLHKLPVG